MKINIDNDTTLYEIQKQFSRHFPYLKLEYFNLPTDGNNQFSRKNVIANTQKKLSEIRDGFYFENISINEHQKVITLKNNWKKILGINIEVFRKSGSIWHETVTTNSWTLAEQNKMGEEITKSLKEELLADYDQYYEQI